MRFTQVLPWLLVLPGSCADCFDTNVDLDLASVEGDAPTAIIQRERLKWTEEGTASMADTASGATVTIGASANGEYIAFRRQ